MKTCRCRIHQGMIAQNQTFQAEGREKISVLALNFQDIFRLYLLPMFILIVQMASKHFLKILKQYCVGLSTFCDFHLLYRELNTLSLHKGLIQNACSNSTNWCYFAKIKNYVPCHWAFKRCFVSFKYHGRLTISIENSLKFSIRT